MKKCVAFTLMVSFFTVLISNANQTQLVEGMAVGNLLGLIPVPFAVSSWKKTNIALKAIDQVLESDVDQQLISLFAATKKSLLRSKLLIKQWGITRIITLPVQAVALGNASSLLEKKSLNSLYGTELESFFASSGVALLSFLSRLIVNLEATTQTFLSMIPADIFKKLHKNSNVDKTTCNVIVDALDANLKFAKAVRILCFA